MGSARNVVRQQRCCEALMGAFRPNLTLHHATMFHVEQRHARRRVSGPRLNLSTANQSLAAGARNPLKHTLVVGCIQFGPKVVEQQHRSFTRPLCQCFCLSHQQRKRQQLCLPARPLPAGHAESAPHVQIGAVRAHRGVSEVAIASAIQQQKIAKPSAVPPPPGPKRETRRFARRIRREPCPSLHQLGKQYADSGLAGIAELFSALVQLGLPRLELVVSGVLPKQRIALPQRAGVAAGQIAEAVFHVERDPVQCSPPLFGRPSHHPG